MDPTQLPLKQLFVLLFMMTGPLKVVPTFAALRLPPGDRPRVIRKAVLVAAAALLVAIFLGHAVMRSWGASPQAVAGAAGLLLGIAALQAILGWGGKPEAPADGDPAMSPLAFPTLVPPYAVGVLILFASFFPDTASLGRMAGLAIGIMALNWAAMTFAEQILRVLRPTALRVLGSVFGVLQLSLAIEMVLYAVRR